METDLKTTFEKLQKIYSSIEYNLLMKKRSQTTYLEVMKKQRSETIFTSMLAWIFSDPDFDKGGFESLLARKKGKIRDSKFESPILYLLRLLALKADDGQIDNDLRIKIMTNELVVKVLPAKTEVSTSKTKGKASDRIDLQLDCIVKDKTNFKEKNLRIFLENKVDSDEHDEQCKKYYKYFTDEKIEDNKNSDYDIFVFLSIDVPKKLSSDKYIKITYQDLLDNVLTLILMQGNYYPDTSIKYLQDFINTITSLKTNGKRQIAMDKETKELLEKFYENNREIIEQAVLTCSDSDELKEALKTSQRDRTKYKLRYKGKEIGNNIPKSKVALTAITHLKKIGKTPEDIKDLLKNCGSFWSTSNGITGYTDLVDFGDDGQYWVHTQRYKGDTFKTLVETLEQSDFECIPEGDEERI